MTHEERNLQTKRTLSEALKQKMALKPVSKITVSELAAACRLNRKTFYYHFEDVYGLLKWTLEAEALEVIRRLDQRGNYADAIRFALDYADNNKHILDCAIDSIGREELKRFFVADFHGITRAAIDRTEAELGLHVAEDFKRLLAALYAEALAGTLIEWIQSRTTPARETLLQDLTLIVRSSLPAVLREAAE